MSVGAILVDSMYHKWRQILKAVVSMCRLVSSYPCLNDTVKGHFCSYCVLGGHRYSGDGVA